MEFQPHSGRDSDHSAYHHEDESELVARIVGLSEEVGRDDISDLAEDVAECHCNSAILWRAAHGTRHPRADQRVRGVHAADVEEGGAVAGAAVHR